MYKRGDLVAGQPSIAQGTMGTLRQQIIGLLQEGPMDRRALSQALGIKEKEVAMHLDHVAKSVRAQNMRWIVEPALCLSCDYQFKDRRRLSRPGKCPKCKNERIQGPWFRIVND